MFKAFVFLVGLIFTQASIASIVVTEQASKEMERQAYNIFLTLSSDLENLGIPKSAQNEVREFYREQILQKNRICGMGKSFACQYARDLQTYKIMNAYLADWRQAKKTRKTVPSINIYAAGK